MSAIMLIAGMALLAFAGDALVRGSVDAAQRLHVPQIVIGLTIVAFGTSAPELIVSLQAALAGSPGLAMGNVVGSNVANTLLVLGMPAIIAPIVLTGAGIRRSYVFMIVVTTMLILVAQDLQISRVEGIGLFMLLVVYLVYSGYAANGERKKKLGSDQADEDHDEALSPFKATGLILFGIIGLAIGGKLTTEGALGVAHMFGIAESTVGLTIVALGTSLPELAAGISAAYRRQTGVVIGNIIGSNIFNILGILGITSMIVPLEVGQSILRFDMWIVLAAGIIMQPIVFKTRGVNRLEGMLLTAGYLIYTLVVINNGMAA